MIASEEEEIFWVFDFIGEEQGNALDGVFPTIDVVSQEEIVCVAREASIFECLY